MILTFYFGVKILETSYSMKIIIIMKMNDNKDGLLGSDEKFFESSDESSNEN